jgi:predicted RNA-binding Zn-ribbon protein involved in translation (DUF1610 family)
MSPHPWLQSLDTVAICPKCGDGALHRSRSRTKIEKLLRRYSFRRQFRCHSCGWRGWYDETRLRYPAPARSVELPAPDAEDLIPSIDLNAELPPASELPTPHASPVADDTLSPAQSNKSAAAADNESPKPALSSQDEFHPPDFYSQDRPAKLSYDVPVQEYRHRRKKSGYDCPKCSNPSLFRSRHRGMFEFIRKNMSNLRPYRCHKCGWRGWLKKM